MTTVMCVEMFEELQQSPKAELIHRYLPQKLHGKTEITLYNENTKQQKVP
jgi:hypothetical protein